VPRGRNVTKTSLVDDSDLSKIGNILLITGIITREDLVEAIEYQVCNKNIKIGEILLKLDKISEKDLSMAMDKQKEMRKRGAKLVNILHELWKVNLNRNKESVRQRQIVFDTVDTHMRKVGC
jgi:hypothetical protein